jgi:hypothetical protein
MTCRIEGDIYNLPKPVEEVYNVKPVSKVGDYSNIRKQRRGEQ